MRNAGRRQGGRGPQSYGPKSCDPESCDPASCGDQNCRHERRGTESTASAPDSFHQEVRRRRQARGLSRDELAARAGYSRQYVGQLEQPSRGIPPRPVVVAVDAVLEARGALVELRDRAAAARAEREAQPLDPGLESRRRVHDLLHGRRHDTVLDYLDRTVGELIAMADTLSPPDVRARVLHHQEFIDGLLRTPMLPHQQFRLYMIAGHLAGLLAIALLDQGDLTGAGTCCLEAAVFTELTGHEGLRAWTIAVSRLVDEAVRHATAHAAARPGAAQGALATDVAAPEYRSKADERGGHQPASGLTGPPVVARAEGYGEPGYGEPNFGEPSFGDLGFGDEADPLGLLAMPEAAEDPIVRRADELATGRADVYGCPAPDTEPTSPPWRGLGDLLTAPGGPASTPRLVALVKDRIARFATTTSSRRDRPLPGLSRAFQPPV